MPIGVVGIAVGTVLLPEMSRRIASGDLHGAALAQARGIQLALLITVPCVAGAIAIPDLIMRALFARGAFTAADAAAAGATLAAYAVGLLPFVMLRSFTAPFYARGDTLTPVKAALLAAAVNIALKVVLMGPLAQVGLALATSVGAWINLCLLTIFARRKGFAVSGAGLRPVIKLLLAGAVLAGALFLGNRTLPTLWPGFRISARRRPSHSLPCRRGGLRAVVLLLLGRGWLGGLLKDVGTAADAAPATTLEQPSADEASAALPDNDAAADDLV